MFNVAMLQINAEDEEDNGTADKDGEFGEV